MTDTENIQVLLIDDDEELGEIIRRYLEGFHFQVTVAEVPSIGFNLLKNQSFDVVLLDVMLPEIDGFEVCREIVSQPEKFGNIPVIMLTARGDAIDRIVGLELGAQDYLPKPFEPRELLARIRNVVRRQNPAPPEKKAPQEGLWLDCKSQQVCVDGRPVELTGMEWQLLALLSSEPGRLFSRDDIMDALKGIDADIFSRAIDALISRLRSKLKDTARKPRFIKTVWGRGYVFIHSEED